MLNGSLAPAATAAPETVAPVRTAVRALLEQSEAYRALPLAEQKALANHMVKVGTYLADPAWLDAPPTAQPLGDGQEKESNPVDDLKKRLAAAPGQVGSDFTAGGVREGVEAFGQLVKKVDFPAFVSGLVNGVFKAVVDASIQQMQAYGELLAATAKTVDQFANDHISEGQARDYIANRYPSAVQVDTSGEGTARLKPKDEGTDAVDLGKAFNVGKSVDLNDPESELALVNAAKLEMARSKQQLLATMVLLGINRIVVTNGQINAKVIFDMRADDSAKRHATAEMHDEQKTHAEVSAGVAGWGGFGGAYTTAGTGSSHVATVGSAVDDTSEAKAAVNANLTGEVRLNFKSETFPLERMVDTGGMQMLNQRAQPGPVAQAPASGASR